MIVTACAPCLKIFLVFSGLVLEETWLGLARSCQKQAGTVFTRKILIFILWSVNRAAHSDVFFLWFGDVVRFEEVEPYHSVDKKESST